MTKAPKFKIQNLKLICVLGLFFIAAFSPLWAQTDDSPAQSKSPLFFLDLGAKYVGWDTNNAMPDNGLEILAPLTLSFVPWKDFRFYGQAEYAVGNYTDSAPITATETYSPSRFSDTVVGMEANFNSFSLPSLVNIGINIPTGDPSWELKQSNSIVPTQFLDGDYRGRGFGLSFLYGLSLPAGGAQYGIAAGYLYSGAFNPYYDQGVSDQLKLGDSAFLSVNRAVEHGGNQNEIIRVSAFYFLPTLQNGVNSLQMGPNFNASYSWSNPNALSFEVGGQYFLPVQKAVNGQLLPETNNSLGPRFYLSPSYVFGNLTLSGRFKYILANGYPAADPLYDGGGFIAGLEPSYRLKLDEKSALRFSAGYDYINWFEGGANGPNRVNMEYGHWSFGTHYEVSL